MPVIIYEDRELLHLGPLAQTRPVFDLRCGAVSLVQRQQRFFDVNTVCAFVRPEMAAVCRFLYPHMDVNKVVHPNDEPVLLINGRWLALGSLPHGREPAVGLVGDQIAFVCLPAGAISELAVEELPWQLSHWRDTLPHREAGGAMIKHPWDLVEHSQKALLEDGLHWQRHRESQSPAGYPVQGPAEMLLVDPSARIESMVLIDTTKGPVMIDRGVIVQAFSRLEGPCYIGAETHVLAGRVKGASIGPMCRIGGEVEESIIQGFTNKAHEGFLGHSYLGEWVNFGSGTQTSDLRNDYAKVSVIIGGRKVETGLLKVGSFVGDHTKTSINTMFNTGSVAGPFGMLVTDGGLMPKNIPAFCQVNHGRMKERTDLGQMFITARTMMGRRNVPWTAAHEDFYLDLYERTAGERSGVLRDSEQRRVRRAV